MSRGSAGSPSINRRPRSDGVARGRQKETSDKGTRKRLSLLRCTYTLRCMYAHTTPREPPDWGGFDLFHQEQK